MGDKIEPVTRSGQAIVFDHLLLLEDDVNLRRTLSRILILYSNNLHVCKSINEARSVLDEVQPELIIADYSLPDGTLIELSESIPAGTEVVAISALATAEESFQLAKLGVSEFLTKPFGLEKIEEALARFFAKRSGAKSLVIKTFGGLSLKQCSGELTFSKKPPYKLLSMLKVILAFGGINVPVHKVCDCLWEDSDGDVAGVKFHTSLHRLRKLIGPAAIMQKNNTVSLNAKLVDLDIWVLDGLGDKTTSWVNETHCPNHFLQPWLPEDESSWLIAPREKYQNIACELFGASSDSASLIAHKSRDYIIPNSFKAVD